MAFSHALISSQKANERVSFVKTNIKCENTIRKHFPLLNSLLYMEDDIFYLTLDEQ
jgi:hypothetical protein